MTMPLFRRVLPLLVQRRGANIAPSHLLSRSLSTNSVHSFRHPERRKDVTKRVGIVGVAGSDNKVAEEVVQRLIDKFSTGELEVDSENVEVVLYIEDGNESNNEFPLVDSLLRLSNGFGLTSGFARISQAVLAEHMSICSFFYNLDGKKEPMKVLHSTNLFVPKDSTIEDTVTVYGGIAVNIETNLAQEESSINCIYERVVSFLSSELNTGDVPMYVAEDSGSPFKTRYSYGPTEGIVEYEDPQMGLVSTEVPILYHDKFEVYNLIVAGSELGANTDWETDESTIITPQKFSKVSGKNAVYPPAPCLDSVEDKTVISELVQDYVSKVKKSNQEEFLNFLISPPAISMKKNQKNKYISTEDVTDAFLYTGKQPTSRLETRRRSATQSLRVPEGEDFGGAMLAFRKAKHKADTTGLPISYPAISKKLFLHFEHGFEKPCFIYPTVYRLEGAHFARGEPPYRSPKLHLPFSLHRAEQNGYFFLGIQDNISPQQFRISFPAYTKYVKKETNGRLIHFLGCELFGKSRLEFHTVKSLSNSGEKIRINTVSVVGAEKEMVGKTFARLRLVVGDISNFKGVSVNEDHPLFDLEGFIVEEVGALVPLSIE